MIQGAGREKEEPIQKHKRVFCFYLLQFTSLIHRAPAQTLMLTQHKGGNNMQQGAERLKQSWQCKTTAWGWKEQPSIFLTDKHVYTGHHGTAPTALLVSFIPVQEKWIRTSRKRCCPILKPPILAQGQSLAPMLPSTALPLAWPEPPPRHITSHSLPKKRPVAQLGPSTATQLLSAEGTREKKAGPWPCQGHHSQSPVLLAAKPQQPHVLQLSF